MKAWQNQSWFSLHINMDGYSTVFNKVRVESIVRDDGTVDLMFWTPVRYDEYYTIGRCCDGGGAIAVAQIERAEQKWGNHVSIYMKERA